MYTAILSIVIGLIVGALSGALGIGGGTVLVPVFKLIYGMPAIVCTATSLFTIIPTSITGATTHIKNKTCIISLGVATGIGGAITSPIGVRLANISPDWLVMFFAAIVIFYSCITMFKKALKAPKQSKNSRQNKTLVHTPFNTAPNNHTANTVLAAQKYSSTDILKAASIGLIAGLASGYVGVGGGFLIVPLMMQFIKIPMKLTSGTSLIAVMILAVPGTITQALLGNVDWIAGICIAIGSIPGAVIGANLMRHIPERTLRFVFSLFLLFASITLILEQIAF
jgi:hypothetical protein